MSGLNILKWDSNWLSQNIRLAQRVAVNATLKSSETRLCRIAKKLVSALDNEDNSLLSECLALDDEGDEKWPSHINS